jgi:hypothetical protein
VILFQSDNLPIQLPLQSLGGLILLLKLSLLLLLNFQPLIQAQILLLVVLALILELLVVPFHDLKLLLVLLPDHHRHLLNVLDL